MVQSFFTFFFLLVCVNTALIPARFIARDSTPPSVTPAISLPSRAIPCIKQAVASETTCGPLDLVCQCDPENASLIQGEATRCVISVCGIQEALQVLDDATAQCSSALASVSVSASAAPSSDSSFVVPSASHTTAIATSSSISGTSAVRSPSATTSSAVFSATPSAVASSVPNNSPNATFIIPNCALGCIPSAIGLTSCTLTNLTCQCDTHNAGVIQSATANCIVSICGGDGERIAVDVQRSQAANCTALSPPAIAGTVTANGPTQISLPGNPSGVSTALPLCGHPIPGSFLPPYYGYPSGFQPTDPFGSLPTPPSTHSDPGSAASSTDISVDPSRSSGPAPTDPSSSVPSDGSFPLGGSSISTGPVDPSLSRPSDGSLSLGGSSIPTDPPGSAASSTYPRHPSRPSITISPGDGNGNGGPGYGGYYPSGTPPGGDPSNSSSSVSVSSSAIGPASSLSPTDGPPSTSGGNFSLPSLSGGGSSSPSITEGDPSLPSTTGGDPSSPATSVVSDNPSPFPSGTHPSSPSAPNYSSPPSYYGYGPVPPRASIKPTPTPKRPKPHQTSPPFRLTLLPSNYSLLTYIVRVYFGFSPLPFYISTTGTTTHDPTLACTFTISEPEGLLRCSNSHPSTSIPRYLGDEDKKKNDNEFASVWEWGLRTSSEKPTRSGNLTNAKTDLNGSVHVAVDTTSEYPYGSLLQVRLVHGDLVGNGMFDEHARFYTQTTPSTSGAQTQTQTQTQTDADAEADAFLEGSLVRANINGTQALPDGWKEVKLVIEWVDIDRIGETPGYA
ncbi:hypothetical protein DSL72_002938 [Monilinia vaccinii-corymbosi]|uniref:CFEM domain-containing protein n=1 Tax=Monilinia vaccinii-corymbosi TaxID=61207 RepID=A0A8A3PE39_9HELO|nr:hypothetical protein DSL72_002938 [Monilinia vaccinii-corymbosi]